MLLPMIRLNLPNRFRDLLIIPPGNVHLQPPAHPGNHRRIDPGLGCQVGGLHFRLVKTALYLLSEFHAPILKLFK